MYNKRLTKYGTSDKAYYIISGFLMTLLLIIVAYPLIYVLSASFSSGNAISSGRVFLWPVEFTLKGYRMVFAKPDILTAYLNTIIYTVLGTFINVFMAISAAYSLSRSDLKGRNVIMLLFVFIMLFSGGLIPTYMLVNKLGLIDTIWAVILPGYPGAFSVYYMIISRTFLQTTIPNELREASSMDGCSDARYFFSVVLPLSVPLIAVISLFSAVAQWNTYFNAMLYVNDRRLLPLQIILREILIMSQIDVTKVSDPELAIEMANMADVLKYALIVVATVPILCAYPFVQRYFIKGVMVGSIKG